MNSNINSYYLDFLLVVPLETGEEHLPLPRLQPINKTRDGTLVVGVGKQHQLLVDEVRVVHCPGVLDKDRKLDNVY